MNTSALYSCLLRQPIELSLKKSFQLLRCQDGNCDRGRLARRRLDLHTVWGFRIFCIRSHATPLSGVTKGGGVLERLYMLPAFYPCLQGIACQDRGIRFWALFLFLSLTRTALPRDRSRNFNISENLCVFSLRPRHHCVPYFRIRSYDSSLGDIVAVRPEHSRVKTLQPGGDDFFHG